MDELCEIQGCDRRLQNLEEHKEHMLDPEVGALAGIHKKVNKTLLIAIPVLLFLLSAIGGSYAYTNRVETKMYETVATKGDVRDFKEDMGKRMDMFEANVMKKLDELGGGNHDRRGPTQ